MTYKPETESKRKRVAKLLDENFWNYDKVEAYIKENEPELLSMFGVFKHAKVANTASKKKVAPLIIGKRRYNG